MQTTIKNFLTWLLQPLSDFWNKPYSIRYVEDPIEAPKKKLLYIIGTTDDPWQVEMLCPCGCKDKIILPVNKSTEPRWTLEIRSEKTPSLSPSIWRSKGCKSHFFLKRGKIYWF